MTREVVRLTTDTDQEEVARAIQRYDFLALPVVDREQRLVGIVTVDDVIDVIQHEATRDLHAAGAVQAGDEDDYFQSSLFTVARRRVVWLIVLLIANTGTSALIVAEKAVLQQMVVLAAFIPLSDRSWRHRGGPERHRGDPRPQHPAAAGAGGGAQHRPRSPGRLPVGLLDGVGGGALGLDPGGNPQVAAAAGISLVVITTLAAAGGPPCPCSVSALVLIQP
jgi:magnesium transporter